MTEPGPPPLPEPEAAPTGPPPLPAAAIAGRDLPKLPRRRRWRVAAGVALAGVVSLGALWWFAFAEGREVASSAADRDLVLRIEDLAEWIEDFDSSSGKAALKKTRHADGSIDLEYEFEGEDTYLSCTVFFERTVQDARMVWFGTKLMSNFALGKQEGVTVEDRPDFLRHGDDSRAALLIRDGSTIGHFFACRMGTRVFVLALGGVAFDEASDFRELVVPVLERVRTRKPS